MSDTSWMTQENQPAGQLMAEIQKQTEELRRLEFEMMAAEDAFEKAKKAFNDFAIKTLPDLYLTNGITSMSTPDGATISIVTKTSASIKKGSDQGKTSKQSIAKWLREHNGENLIKSECHVASEARHLLEETGIPYEETMDINTNSLKAFVIDALGQNGSPATITPDDLPQGLSFYQWNQAEVSVGK